MVGGQYALPLKIIIPTSWPAPPLLFQSPNFSQARAVRHTAAKEDLGLFWHSTLSDLCVKSVIHLIKQFTVHITEPLTAATWSATGELQESTDFYDMSYRNGGKVKPNTWTQTLSRVGYTLDSTRALLIPPCCRFIGSFHLVKLSCIWISVSFSRGMHSLTIIFPHKTDI